ncbi:MAG: 1-(5-phosphoribosyl)-5-((5-phosphoribosylamino)methylideneamino)imidazole-4-carboxamide isomerase [Myxococcales bacterium]|nr:1-(5-phosphoribosyl)-5-((5-phosphoribosylamino)methylideneamino)imidazole-4-carboxamide isomerase [Myxococcales bacterium]|tara:strand:- start:743 stop:1522 length:780 start_codon:yes stop_codon:yes gene_type:complete
MNQDFSFDPISVGFRVIPAIDLLDGCAVRLWQGGYDSASQVAPDPVEAARRFRDAGIRRLHVVDLSGAREGTLVHLDVIARIVKEVGISVQVGGGVRTAHDVEQLFDAGVSEAILGTVALEDPERAAALIERWPGRLFVGLDARGDTVALRGWLKDADESLYDAALRVAQLPVAGIIYTDISRDGTGRGPNIENTAALARLVQPTPTIASGGIGNEGHVLDLWNARDEGIHGVIVGKAIYDGVVDLDKMVSKYHRKENP